MLYVPPISDYKPFYIQLSNWLAAKDIMTEYSVIIKTHPYPANFKVKEPYKNQWLDEHGDEEYIGSAGLYLEPFTMTLECVMFATNTTFAAAVADLKNGIRTFQNALLGAGQFKIYDAWNDYGFQNVRLSEFAPQSSESYDAWGDTIPSATPSTSYKARAIFSLTLKINDPKTLMKLSNGAIVAA